MKKVMEFKSDKKKKTNYSSQISLKNPFHWWGLVLLIIGVPGGGGIGGALGGLCGMSIFAVGNNERFSTTKKVGISLLITIGGLVGYIILALIFLSFLTKN